MKKGRQIGFGLMMIAAIVAVLCALLQATSKADGRLSQLTKQKEELDRMLAENQAPKNLSVDETELARLRTENAELPMLRNQVHQLRDAIKAKDSEEPAAIQELHAENQQLQEQKQELVQLHDRATCIKNLQLIDAAKTRLVEENKMLRGETVTMDNLARFLPNGVPVCPDGGHYSINRVGAPPACSIPGHSIP
jgi:gas vesicle protein